MGNDRRRPSEARNELHQASQLVDGCASYPLRSLLFPSLTPPPSTTGPKQTKCLISDENEHIEPEEYIANETTTRTPDVPSGNDFSVKTKSVFTWSELGGCRVKVTTEVAWTKVGL